jgi:hypothetical protein
VLRVGTLQIRAVWGIRRGSSCVGGRLLVAPGSDYIEVIFFTADALGKIHREFLAPLPDLHVVG